MRNPPPTCFPVKLPKVWKPGQCALNCPRATSDGNTGEYQGVTDVTRPYGVNLELFPLFVLRLTDKILDGNGLESHLIESR